MQTVATTQGVQLLMLVDDEPAQRRFVSALAARGGWRTIFADDHESAIAMLDTPDGMALDAIIIDQFALGDDCSTLVRDLRAMRPSLPIIIHASADDRASTIDAVQAGADDFVEKPLAGDRLLVALNHAIASHAKGELRPFTEKLAVPLDIDEIIGSAPKFRQALAIAAKAARARVPVLIEGEAGVGKDVIARAIHAASPRARAPLVTIDCGIMPAKLIGPMLFGFEQGAFPGAFERKQGRIERADTGTIIIHRIEELPADAQAMLLQVLETRTVVPIGETRPRTVDVRFIVTATASLATRARAGHFREDLLAKLSAVEFSIPPLRERLGDIPALARHLLGRYATMGTINGRSISDDALALLAQYRWPGNVRQLQDCLFRAAARAETESLHASDFVAVAAAIEEPQPTSIGGHAAASNGQRTDGIGITLYLPDGNLRPLEEIEADVIRLAIGHYRGRMSEVARRLGIGRSTLYRKLADLGIDTAA